MLSRELTSLPCRARALGRHERLQRCHEALLRVLRWVHAMVSKHSFALVPSDHVVLVHVTVSAHCHSNTASQLSILWSP